MFFLTYRPNICSPAATDEQLMHYARANRTLKRPMLISALLLVFSVALLCLALLDYPRYLSACSEFAAINMAFMLALAAIQACREFEQNQLSALDDNETIELANLLANTKNPEMLRFAAEVKRQRRCFRRSELQALRLYAETATTKEAAEKAREYLYH